jgi:hypothetical protein
MAFPRQALAISCHELVEPRTGTVAPASSALPRTLLRDLRLLPA